MYIPSDWEVRTWPEFVKLLRSKNTKDDAQYLLKEYRYPSGLTIKEMFEWAWTIEEAEMIHKSFTE